MFKHVGIEEKDIEGCLGMGIEMGFEKGVVEKGVRAWNSVEDFESVVELVVFGAEVDNARHGVVVGGETKAEDEGVVLFELRHG